MRSAVGRENLYVILGKSAREGLTPDLTLMFARAA
jgi:hypothetical protein